MSREPAKRLAFPALCAVDPVEISHFRPPLAAPQFDASSRKIRLIGEFTTSIRVPTGIESNSFRTSFERIRMHPQLAGPPIFRSWVCRDYGFRARNAREFCAPRPQMKNTRHDRTAAGSIRRKVFTGRQLAIEKSPERRVASNLGCDLHHSQRRAEAAQPIARPNFEVEIAYGATRRPFSTTTNR